MSSGFEVFLLIFGNSLIQEVYVMAYRITYDSKKEREQTPCGIRRFFLTTLFFICFLWMVTSFWPEGKALMKLLLLPGDPDTTLQAAEVFAAELESGFPLTDAARNFCDAVLVHGF